MGELANEDFSVVRLEERGKKKGKLRGKNVILNILKSCES
ncbi:MAG: hypothetical protein ACJAWV_001688 [Flammeovirgaceae bacterium]